MAQMLDITWDDLDARIARFAGLTGYAGEATGLTSTATDVTRYLAMWGSPRGLPTCARPRPLLTFATPSKNWRLSAAMIAARSA